MDIHLRERMELLKFLEARNNELAKAFAKYRETEKAKWPELGIDEELRKEENRKTKKASQGGQ